MPEIYPADELNQTRRVSNVRNKCITCVYIERLALIRSISIPPPMGIHVYRLSDHNNLSLLARCRVVRPVRRLVFEKGVSVLGISPFGRVRASNDDVRLNRFRKCTSDAVFRHCPRPSVTSSRFVNGVVDRGCSYYKHLASTICRFANRRDIYTSNTTRGRIDETTGRK